MRLAPSRGHWIGLCVVVGLLAVAAAVPVSSDSRGVLPALLAEFNPGQVRMTEGRALVPFSDGKRAVLTLDVGLQRHLEALLVRHHVPRAAVVAMEPATGRILAYVNHGGGPGDDVVRDASAPAASIFKLITGAALVDTGVKPNTRVCYGGGARRLVEADLRDDPKRDRACATMGDALGRSINAVFAKLADRNLSETVLERYASAFAFGQRLPVDVPTPPSKIDVPSQRLERARMAAGFRHANLSPMHGALLAATIANDGNMPWAALIDRVEDRDGQVVYRHEPRRFRAVLPSHSANQLRDMMTNTVTHGTSRKAFVDPAGRPFLPGISVAGKTGSLSAPAPYSTYNWWVGFAPADDPKIAVAALVINKAIWHIKASYVAREVFRQQLR